MGYAIRLPANRVLQDKIGYLLKRPVGRPPQEVRRYYRAGSWNKPRRVVAKVEWHPGKLYPRVGFIRLQPGAAGGARHRLLQPPRHLRAVHQTGQGRDQVDPPVVPLPSPPTPSAFSSMPWPTTSAISCGRWRCRRRRSRGR